MDLIRRALFTHMYKDHSFNIGLLENLVMVDEFLKILSSLLSRNICIYCHNVFRTAGCLRKHMKNKRHYKIDSKNHFYDRYYIVNYVKGGPNSHNQTSHQEDVADESDWDDLIEEIDHRTTCLFCQMVFPSPGKDFNEHLLSAHDFDFEAERQRLMDGEFYDYIKAVTFIRSQICNQKCPVCDKEFDSSDELDVHLSVENHSRLPSKAVWDKTQYLFPVFDDDPILFYFGESLDE